MILGPHLALKGNTDPSDRCIVDYNLAHSRNGTTLGYNIILILILATTHQGLVDHGRIILAS
jgi:hypothetical protein